jgi:hypothetical protein
MILNPDNIELSGDVTGKFQKARQRRSEKPSSFRLLDVAYGIG